MVLAGLVLDYFWRAGEFKNRALKLAGDACRQYNLQLLDQTVVIRGYWPTRRISGNWAMRRSYEFEFTSTGSERYRGRLVLVGMELADIEFQAYHLS